MRFMDEASIIEYITTAFDDVNSVNSDGNSFFFYGSNDKNDHKFPFVTLVTNDSYDQFSNLDRSGVYRLNIGVSKQTFQRLFGENKNFDAFDFTVLDKIIPHPIYGKMYWICVLSPSTETFEIVKPLLAEAYEADVKKHTSG